MNPAEWTGIFQGIHLRLRGRENGIVQVTRDLDGQFRETPYSPVCNSPEGKWTRRTEKGEEVLALPGLSVRVNPETGTLTFRDGGGSLLLRATAHGCILRRATPHRSILLRDGLIAQIFLARSRHFLYAILCLP